MELEHLYYFLDTAGREHMTRSSQSLHLAQPSLSRAVANVEKYVGAPLFQRENKRLRLNEDGRTFLASARQSVTILDETVDRVRELAGLRCGGIRIAMPFGAGLFNSYISAFIREHREVSMQQYLMTPQQLEAALLDEEIDLALSPELPGDSRISAAVIHAEPLAAVLPGDEAIRRIRLEELRTARFVINNIGLNQDQRFRELCQQAGFTPQIIYSGPSANLVGSLAAIQLGTIITPLSAQLSQRTSREDSREKRPASPGGFALITNPGSAVPIYLLCCNDHLMSRAARLFMVDFVAYLQGVRSQWHDACPELFTGEDGLQAAP